MPTLSLIAACFNAPLIGVDEETLNSLPVVLHAIEMKQVVAGWERGWVESACGVSPLKLFAAGAVMGLWPPRVRGLSPNGKVRCRDCQKATGSKRPRCEFVAPLAEVP